ncbi:MAG: hypothetical protein R3B96_12875, partial [Pirellulaceae bacterium]
MFELLLNSLDPIKSLNQLLAQGLVSVSVAGAAIARLLSDRTGTLLRVARAGTKVDHPALAILVRIYSADYQGLTFTPEELRQLLEQLLATSYRMEYSDKGTFLRHAIKTRSISAIESTMAATKIMIHGRLPTYCVTGILRVASENGETYREWRTRLAPTPLECVQISELDVLTGVVDSLNHREVTRALTESVSPSVLKDLRREVLPFFQQIEAQGSWLDVRLDPQVRRDFLGMIAERLESKKPLSVIRLGDGESYAWQDRVSAERADFRERFWWGKALPAEQRAKIAAAIHEAIEQADVLGVPSIIRFARDLHPGIESIFDEPSTRELLIILQGVTDLRPADRSFTEERVHQVCFTLPDVLALAANATKLVMVSSVLPSALESLTGPLTNRLPVEVILVPTHSKTSENALFHRTDERLPDIYPRIDQQVAEAAEPGALVLVACGSIGKIFCHTAQRSGAVVLDVGAMADYWAGVKTRSVADLV